jgi:hypothetical protein
MSRGKLLVAGLGVMAHRHDHSSRWRRFWAPLTGLSEKELARLAGRPVPVLPEEVRR